MQDPEVNDLSLDDEADPKSVTAEVRIVRNSACCGDEMKEYTFNTEEALPDEMVAKIAKIKAADPEATFEVEEGSIEILEEGGHRYKKSYYGYQLSANVSHDGTVLGSVDLTDKIDASSMDELA